MTTVLTPESRSGSATRGSWRRCYSPTGSARVTPPLHLDDAAPQVVVHVVTSKVAPLASPRARSPRTDHQPVVRRARWNPPTRWQRERSRSRHLPQFFVLLMLAAFAVMCVELGWIDLQRWREILADYI